MQPAEITVLGIAANPKSHVNHLKTARTSQNRNPFNLRWL
jgi:hypothetical protein